MLMTKCSSRTPRRRGRLASKVKGSVATWRRPSSWSLVLAKMSSRNLASALLSALVVSPKTPSSAHSACFGSTRSAVVSLCDWCNGEARPIDSRTVTDVDVDGTMLDVAAIFCYLGDVLCSGGGYYDSVIAAVCYVTWGNSLNSCLS